MWKHFKIVHLHAHVWLVNDIHFSIFARWCSDILSCIWLENLSLHLIARSVFDEWAFFPVKSSPPVRQSVSLVFSLLFWAVFTFPDSSVPHHQLCEVTAHILGLQRGLAHWKRAAQHTHTHTLKPSLHPPTLSFSLAFSVTHIHLHPRRPLCPSINS